MDILQGLFRAIASLGWPVALVTLIIEDETCSSVLFNDNFLDKKCLSLAISKSISYALILGACLYKIPVVLKIVSKRAGDGLNMLGMYLETSAFTASIFYSYLRGQPLTTYGDLFAVISANVVIILLVWLWGANGKKIGLGQIIFVLGLSGAFVAVASQCPPQYYTYLANYSTVVLTLSRLPQIISNATTGNIGVQSAVTIGNAMLGSFAKIFVLFVETDDLVLLMGSVIGFSCNLVLFCQVLFMKPVDSKDKTTSKGVQSSSTTVDSPHKRTATGTRTKAE